MRISDWSSTCALPIFQSVLGYSTIKAGAVLLPQAVVLMVNAPLSSVWVQRFGNKVVVTAGLLLVTASLLLFNTLDAGSDMLHVILISMVMGLGMANIMASSEERRLGEDGGHTG